MIDYDIEKVSPRPWQIGYDDGSASGSRRDPEIIAYIENTVAVRENARGDPYTAREIEELTNCITRRGIHKAIVDGSGASAVVWGGGSHVPWGVVTDEDALHLIHCVNTHEALTADNQQLREALKAVDEWRIYRTALSMEGIDGFYPTSASDFDSLEDCYEAAALKQEGHD